LCCDAATAQTATHLDMEDDVDEKNSPRTKTFQAIDAHQYCLLSTTDTKHRIYDFAADSKDCYVAVIEVCHTCDLNDVFIVISAFHTDACTKS